MKKISFIRHYKLEPPYDKKETLSAKQRILLGRGEVDPGIHSDITAFFNKNKSNNFCNFDIILSSPTKRTLETAKSIIKFYKLTLPIQIEESLKESVFVFP